MNLEFTARKYVASKREPAVMGASNVVFFHEQLKVTSKIGLEPQATHNTV